MQVVYSVPLVEPLLPSYSSRETWLFTHTSCAAGQLFTQHWAWDRYALRSLLLEPPVHCLFMLFIITDNKKGIIRADHSRNTFSCTTECISAVICSNTSFLTNDTTQQWTSTVSSSLTFIPFAFLLVPILCISSLKQRILSWFFLISEIVPCLTSQLVRLGPLGSGIVLTVQHPCSNV